MRLRREYGPRQLFDGSSQQRRRLLCRHRLGKLRAIGRAGGGSTSTTAATAFHGTGTTQMVDGGQDAPDGTRFVLFHPQRFHGLGNAVPDGGGALFVLGFGRRRHEDVGVTQILQLQLDAQLGIAAGQQVVEDVERWLAFRSTTDARFF